MSYKRSKAKLVAEYRKRYKSLVTLNPNIGSFDEWIRDEYNTKLKKMRLEIAGTETSAKYLKPDEYSDYKRVKLSKYMKAGVVEKNRSRAVMRLDIINDLSDRDYLTKKEILSNKKAVKAVYKDFIKSKNVSDASKKGVKDFINSATSSKGRATNQTILFDFLQRMRKEGVKNIDAQYKYYIEDLFNDISNMKTKASQSLDIKSMTSEEFRNMLNMFKLNNSRKYGLSNESQRDLIRDMIRSNMRSEDEENFKTIVDMKVRAGFMKLTNNEAIKLGYSPSEIDDLKKTGAIK